MNILTRKHQVSKERIKSIIESLGEKSFDVPSGYTLEIETGGAYWAGESRIDIAIYKGGNWLFKGKRIFWAVDSFADFSGRVLKLYDFDNDEVDKFFALRKAS